MDNIQMIKRIVSSDVCASQSGQVSACIQAFKQIKAANHPGILLHEFATEAKQAWFVQDNSTQESGIQKLLSSLEDKASEDYAEKSNLDEAIASMSDILYYLPNYTNLVDGIINYISTQGYEEDTYYEKLWSALYAVIGDVKEIEKGVALYAVLLDRRTPYYYLGKGTRMSDEQYKAITDELSEPLNKLLYALSLNFSQKTEFASIILSILQGIESEEKQLVFLSQMITIIKQARA